MKSSFVLIGSPPPASSFFLSKPLRLSGHVNSITFYFPPFKSLLQALTPVLVPWPISTHINIHTYTVVDLVLHLRETMSVSLPEPGVFTHFPTHALVLFPFHSAHVPRFQHPDIQPGSIP